MEIIRHGKTEKVFECKACGCLFSARQNEYREFNRAVTGDIRIFVCECPECGENSFGKDEGVGGN